MESTLYARTSGYLRKWDHDIGSRVAKGTLLAELDAPEVDQQLSQARADLGTAEANARLAGPTAARLREVVKTDGVSKQEFDNAVGDSEAKAGDPRVRPGQPSAPRRSSSPSSASTPRSTASSRDETWTSAPS